MTDWTLEGLATAMRAGKISPVEATRDCLARIERLDGGLRAFITVDHAGALETARRLEAEQGRGAWRGPLHGVPLAFKDLCFIRGLPTSCGTRTAEYFLAEQDCTVVSRLAAAGAVTLGKLNMTELAMGPFGDNAHHGHARNPWRAGHCTGGSSSGSAVAVAAGLALGAVGSDTGGSIRLPAAACGIVGLKPTYGRVSRAGAMPLSWSNDHVGPMARTVRDCALLLQVMAGADALDATASPEPVPDYMAALGRSVAGLRVGVVENYFFQGLDAEMAAAVRQAAQVIAQLGARVSELQRPRSADDERRHEHRQPLRGLDDPRAAVPRAPGRDASRSCARDSRWGCRFRPTTTCRRSGSAPDSPAGSSPRCSPRWTSWWRR